MCPLPCLQSDILAYSENMDEWLQYDIMQELVPHIGLPTRAASTFSNIMHGQERVRLIQPTSQAQFMAASCRSINDSGAYINRG